MECKGLKIFIYVSIALLAVFVGLYMYALVANPDPMTTKANLSFCNIAVLNDWGGNLVISNHEPFISGTIGMAGDKNIDAKGWRHYGLSFVSIKYIDRNLVDWTLLVSIWYPIVVFSILPIGFAIRKLYRPKA